MLAVNMQRRSSSGFTLIELMITLAIAAILLMVAVPNLSAYRRNAELTSAANTFMAGLNTARSEAMKRGRNAIVVPTNNGSNWNGGWVVFVDVNGNQTFNEGTDFVVASQAELPTGVNITAPATSIAGGSTPYIMFDASGYSKLKTSGPAAVTLSFERTDGTTQENLNQTRRIKVAFTGRVRMCKPASATDTNCTFSDSAQ